MHIYIETRMLRRTLAGNYEYLYDDTRARILNRTYDSIQAFTLARNLAWTHAFFNEHLTLARIYALLHAYHKQGIKKRN
jgi:hypothetical protein